jgi:ABC-type nickel/cobalt efflux system permease component RcnA
LTGPVDATTFAIISAAVLGLRHGVDYDHIAAISDIAAVEAQPRLAMRLGVLYAVGHGMTVAALGVAVILFQLSLPAGVDGWMGQVVGATLLFLGIYILYTDLFRSHSHEEVRIRSRVLLIADAVMWLAWRVRQVVAPSSAPSRRLFQNGLGTGSALLLGVIHGVGAETPTQLLVFLLAANLGGIRRGLMGLAAFIVGLLITNLIMCAVAAGVIKVTTNKPKQFRMAARVSAAYSILIGGAFLLGPMLH